MTRIFLSTTPGVQHEMSEIHKRVSFDARIRLGAPSSLGVTLNPGNATGKKGNWTMKILALMALLGIGLMGCVDALPFRKGDYFKGPLPDPQSGKDYCMGLSAATDHAAQVDLSFGIIAALAASAGIVAGGLMGPDTSSNANWVAKNRNAITIGSGALLAVPATILIMRSKDNSKASAAASNALAPDFDGDQAMKQCLGVRADLVNARNNIADIVANDLSARMKAIQKTLEIAKTSDDPAVKEAANKSIAQQLMYLAPPPTPAPQPAPSLPQ